MGRSKSKQIWTVVEAKARLSEILRLVEQEGPQHIGTKKTFVIIPADAWYAKMPPRKPMGQWLVDNMPRGINLDIPNRHESEREIPFITQMGIE